MFICVTDAQTFQCSLVLQMHVLQMQIFGTVAILAQALDIDLPSRPHLFVVVWSGEFHFFGAFFCINRMHLWLVEYPIMEV